MKKQNKMNMITEINIIEYMKSKKHFHKFKEIIVWLNIHVIYIDNLFRKYKCKIIFLIGNNICWNLSAMSRDIHNVYDILGEKKRTFSRYFIDNETTFSIFYWHFFK